MLSVSIGLIVEAFVDILSLIEQDKLPGVFDEDLQARLAVCPIPGLFQTLTRPTGRRGHGTRHWRNCLCRSNFERSSTRLFLQWSRQPLDAAIERGIAYIKSIGERPLNYIWIEKVSYASRLLTDSYVLGALKAASSTLTVEGTIGSSLWQHVSTSTLDKHVKLFSKAELFSPHPEWELQGSMIEAVLLKPLLLKR